VKLTDVGVTLITGAIPLPERVTVAALPASLAILKLALFAPRLVGVNVTGIVQLLPGATDAQLYVPMAYCAASAPVSVTPLTKSGALPVLLTTTDWVALVVPVRWLPNDTVVGLVPITGAVTVPESVTTDGLPDASCVIDSVAHRARECDHRWAA